MAEKQPNQPQARNEKRFADLGAAKRIWAIASIHGEAELLKRLHKTIRKAWQPLDRIVYLGNLLGRGQDVLGTLDELLAFRRDVLAVPNALPEDVAYLRGAQEEMWQKLLQLQFAPNPLDVFKWMLEHGLEATLKAYGGNPAEGAHEARGGALALTRWTKSLREAMQHRPGHFELFSELRRAAFTKDRGLLFVNAGVDPSRPLDAQSDSFWWGHGDFAKLAQPFNDFKLTIRGFDPRKPGIERGDFSMTIDAGAGRGGKLVAVCLSGQGELLEQLEAASAA